MSNIELYHDDCFNVFPTIEDNSIDLVLCDMPYGTTQNKWDSVLKLDSVFHHLARITKDNAAIVLFGQSIFTANLILQSSCYRYTLIWEKSRAGGFLNANKMPLSAHEDITVHYYKLPTFNPIKERGKPYTKKAVTNGDGGNYGKFNRVGTTLDNKGDRFPRSVIKIKNENFKSLHPTQKPVALMEYLIKTYSNEGEIVFDFCMGSGTTGVACKNLSRDFIGIEKEEKYFNIAKERINDQYKDK